VQVDDWLKLMLWDLSLLSILYVLRLGGSFFGSILMRLLFFSSPKFGNLGYLVISIVFSISPFKSGQQMCGLCFYQQNSRFSLSAEISIAVLSQREMVGQDSNVASTLLPQESDTEKATLTAEILFEMMQYAGDELAYTISHMWRFNVASR
jgi:hypothetical protein